MPRVSPVRVGPYSIISSPERDYDSAASASNLLLPTGFNKQNPFTMNAKLPVVLSLAIALMPIAAMAQNRRAGSSVSRPSGGARSAPQFRGTGFRGAGVRGATFRGSGAPVQ